MGSQAPALLLRSLLQTGRKLIVLTLLLGISSALAAEPACQGSQLQKNLTLTHFTRAQPAMANAGQIYDIEAGFAEWLGADLARAGVQAAAPLKAGIRLHTEERAQRRLIQQLARQQSTQFVLLGQISDLTMSDSDSLYNPTLTQRLGNLWHGVFPLDSRDPRTRNIALYIELRDAYTGGTLFSRHYQRRARWDLRGTPGFHSRTFARSAYGRELAALAREMSEDLAQTLACQPFIATIDAAPGRGDLILDRGALQGLRAGDQLELYQLVVVPSQTGYLESETRLIKREGNLRLEEVYPGHSSARLLNGQPLNGSFLAISQ